MDLVALRTMMLVVTPIAVELLVWKVSFGCGHPILMGDWQIKTMTLAVTKSAASSDFAVEVMTNLMIRVRVKIAWISCRSGSSSLRKMCEPTWLQALLSLRYEVSECAASIIF